MFKNHHRSPGDHDTGPNAPPTTVSPGFPLRPAFTDSDPFSCSEYNNIVSPAQKPTYPRAFRILIIGRANSGKTTLLHKICKDDLPEAKRVMRGDYHTYFDKLGANVQQDWAILPEGESIEVVTPTRERGIHDIYREITFPSCPGFIFHDSFGIESGSEDEWDVVKHFIEIRSQARSLEEQLHAIWFCLPTDTDRPLLDVELKFFASQTHAVPVIAVFTKFDAQHVKAYEELRNSGHSPKQSKLLAPAIATAFLEERLIPTIMKTPFPPAQWVMLSDMHKRETLCTDLIRKTAEAMTDIRMRQIFIATQKNNIKLCIEFAVHANYHKTFSIRSGHAGGLLPLVAWFPLTSNQRVFRSQFVSTTDLAPLASILRKERFNIIGRTANSYIIAAKTLIILENCSCRNGKFEDNLNNAIEAFKNANIATTLETRIKNEHKEILEKADDKALQSWLYTVVCDNLIERPLPPESPPRAIFDLPELPQSGLTDFSFPGPSAGDWID